MNEIDSQAIVSPKARLGRDAKIGAYAVIGDDVELGEGCIVEHHGVVQGPARLGRDNHVYSFAIVGGDPQDFTYEGQRTSLETGDANEFREFCTVNRGTVKGGGVTRVGSHNFIMAYTHVGHDCAIGDHTVLINGAQLAGHITVEDYATISACCLLHQFLRVGRYAYIGAGSIVSKDVPPYSMVAGSRNTTCFGVNTVGLERNGFAPERVKPIEQAYRLLLRSKLNTSQAVEKMRGTLSHSEDVLTLIRFIETTERGLTK
jgi:UDP-N-acetylglucosamine acyltransferase